MSENGRDVLDKDPELRHDLETLLKNVLNAPNSIKANKLTELISRLENVTGKKVKSYEEIQQEYRAHLNQDLRKLDNANRQARINALLGQCEINTFWEFENINCENNPEYKNSVEKCLNFVRYFDLYEEGFHMKDIDGFDVFHSPGVLLWIYGDYGVGKSMLAGAVAHSLMREQLVEVDFRQWFTIFQKSQMLKDDDKAYDSYMEHLYNVRLLVIDEVAVDKTKLTEAQRRDLGRVLRARKNNHRNTIIVSNAGHDELQTLIGDFCWESIKNYSTVIMCELKGRNRRPELVGIDPQTMKRLNTQK